MIGTPSLLRPTAARLDWETPQPLFDELSREFRFTLDVCATHANKKCSMYYSLEDDALAHPWGREICWMNPPYGREIGRWMQKAYIESRLGATVVCLVPARTDTAWWHQYAEKAAERRFLRGRVAHYRADGKRSVAPFPSVVVVFRPGSSSEAA